MLAHRLGTLWHIIATTFVGCTKKSHSLLIQENVEGAIELAKRLQKLQGVDEDETKASSIGSSDDHENEYVTVKRKKHVDKLAKAKFRRQKTKNLNDAFAHRFVALGAQIETQNPENLQNRLFENDKGLNRAKSKRAFTKLQENANNIFNEQKMEFINRQIIDAKEPRKGDPETTSLTPLELQRGRIRFASTDSIDEEGGIQNRAGSTRRRRSRSALVVAGRQSSMDIAVPSRIRRFAVTEMKSVDLEEAEEEEEGVAPPTGPRIGEKRVSTASASSTGTIVARGDWSQTRERTESNISAIKSLIELTEKTCIPLSDSDDHIGGSNA